MPHPPVEQHRVARPREHGHRAGQLVVVVGRPVDRVREVRAREHDEVAPARFGEVGEEVRDLDGQPRPRRPLEVPVDDAAVLMPHPRPREVRRLGWMDVQVAVVHEDVRAQRLDHERQRPGMVQQLEERRVPAAERQQVQGAALGPAFGAVDAVHGGREPLELVGRERALDQHEPVTLELRAQTRSLVVPNVVDRHVSGDRGRGRAVPRVRVSPRSRPAPARCRWPAGPGPSSAPARSPRRRRSPR